MIIAIDGPAGAGKSTIAKKVALALGFLYLDTGAMYRALTLKVLEQNISPSSVAEVIALAHSSEINLINEKDNSLKVCLDGRDVSLEIRQPRITKCVSDVAKIKEVREVMVGLQRKLGKEKNCVLDGRDIGTVVFPKAQKKFFLVADFNERVRRRHKELLEMGQEISLEDVAKDLANRDRIDSTRACGPLRQAEDAIRIDTTKMTIDEVVAAVLQAISK